MADLLLELFSEEIPARMQIKAKSQFLDALLTEINSVTGLELSGKSWVTPRRLGIYIDNIPTLIPATTEETRGPKTSAPEMALAGFLKKNNFTKEQLEAKGEYYFVTIKKPETNIQNILGSLISKVIANYTWPKSMRWSDHQIKWVRPLHSILCIFDGNVLPFSFGHVTSSNFTYGHRFMAPEKITVQNYSEYQIKLEEAKVILDTEERKQKILADIDKLATPKNLGLIHDAELLEEIAGLVEYPYVLLGEINREFMDLPREVLVITLKHHQKYLMLNDRNGALAPYFIIVSNRVTDDGGIEVVHGNTKVLRARLYDAKFFYTNDQMQPLASRVELLKKLTFHQELGSVYDKVQSIKTLAGKIAAVLNMDPNLAIRAAELAKADLVTNMVKEFPELQGVMGYYYALNDNEDKQVALAIRDHYKPQGPSDSVPENGLGAIVALADKLDTLNQMFGLGIKPTGSKDPYALRRAAIGISRIITGHKLNLDLQTLGLRDDVIAFINEKSR